VLVDEIRERIRSELEKRRETLKSKEFRISRIQNTWGVILAKW